MHILFEYESRLDTHLQQKILLQCSVSVSVFVVGICVCGYMYVDKCVFVC